MPIDQQILQIIQAHPILNENKTIKLWLMAIQLQQSNKKEDFIQLKKLFFNNFTALSKQDAQMFFVLLNNFYNQHLIEDKAFYAYEGFLLYQFAAKTGLLLKNNRIRDIEYANAATVGFYAGQKEWTFDFLEKFKPYLLPSIQEATYAQVYAYYHFLQGNFELTHEWILKAEQYSPLTLVTAIKIKTLKLRMFFEIWMAGQSQEDGLYQVLESQIDSFKGFIKKHPKLPPIKKGIYLNFAHFFQRLIKIPRKSNLTASIVQFQKDLKENAVVKYKDWLLEKIQQLEIA